METSAILQAIKQAAPGAVLKSGPFGRKSETLSVWIELRRLGDVARALLAHEEGMDWLESIGAVELEGAILLSYFVRSSKAPGSIVLRGTIVPKNAEARVETDSVREHWPMAAPMEAELSELFGIDFAGAPKAPARLLPEGWDGFPLRKSYEFPPEFGGVPHIRPVGHTAPDEHGVHA